MYGFVFVTEGAAVPKHCDKREGDSRIGGNKLRLSPCDSYNYSPLTHVGGNGCFIILKYKILQSERKQCVLCLLAFLAQTVE